MKPTWMKVYALGLALAVPALSQIPSDVALESIYDPTKVFFIQPTGIGPVPGDPNQIVVVERSGKVHRLVKNGALYDKLPWFSVVASDSTHWDGAWSVEFHPKFRENRLFYVLYRLKGSADTRSVIEEWTSDADLANPRKVRDIIFFAQKTIHSSGDIRFGKDGYLYSAQGDRDLGLQGGPLMSEMWGKVIRIDVDRKDPGLQYAIPADNPFKGQAGIRPEIWASGFRVPYRFSFDKLTGDLYLGDVGAAKNEEVNLVEKGKDYGAGKVEGMCTSNCTGLTNPIAVMPRGCVIGGIVYRGDPASKFYGAYIFADYQVKKLLALKLNDAKTGLAEPVKSIISSSLPGMISTMGEDAAGNIYVGTYIETPATSRTHVYRLKHAELRSTPVGIRTPSAPLQANQDPASAGYRAYGLDGKRLAGKSMPGGEVVLLRNGRTGETRKWVRLP